MSAVPLMKIVVIMACSIAAIVLGSAVYFWRNPLKVAARMERRELRKQGFVRQATPAPAGPLIYWTGGKGPLLVFLHGAGDQAGTWSKIAPAFTPTHRVLLIDFPGHGDSAPQEGPITIADELGGLRALLDVEGGSERATLVGNSMGAWVAMLYARQRPERVERIAAVNGGAIRANNVGLTLTPRNRQEARRVMAALRDPGSTRVPDFVLDDVIRTARKGPLGRLIQTAPEMEKYVLDGALATFQTPVEILWGEADRLLGSDYPERLEAALPVSRITRIERCGHVPQRECPSLFAAKLREVLMKPAPAAKPVVEDPR